jgi:hypothetical protein
VYLTKWFNYCGREGNPLKPDTTTVVQFLSQPAWPYRADIGLMSACRQNMPTIGRGRAAAVPTNWVFWKF